MKPWRDRHEGLWIFFVGILLLLPSIWAETSLTGQDEYWLSLRTPMETLDRGEWLTPWVNGEPRLRKPPLLYWLMMGSYTLLGRTLLAARLWGVLAGAGLALCACLIFRELFSRSGRLAGLITLGTLPVAIEGRRAMLDLPLACLIALAVLFALRWGKRHQKGWLALSSIALGLSTLLKGPMGGLYFGLSSGLALSLFRGWREALRKWREILGAGALALLVSLPWPVAMLFLWPEFGQVVGSEIGAREFGLHLHSLLWSPFNALGLLFPWSLVLVAGLVAAFRPLGKSRDPRSLWLGSWFFASLVPCLFIASFARYMVPAIPAGACLCAFWLTTADPAPLRRLLRGTVLLLAVPAALFCGAFLWFGLGPLQAALCLLGTVLLTGWAFASRKAPPVEGTALAVCLLLCLLLGGLYPALGVNALPQGIEGSMEGHPVAVFNSSQPSMLSMRLKRSVLSFRSFVQTDMERLRAFDGLVFVREEDLGTFLEATEGLGLERREMGRIATFYSRKAWVRFAREDAGPGAWERAFRERSLDGLKAGIVYFRVFPPGKGIP